MRRVKTLNGEAPFFGTTERKGEGGSKKSPGAVSKVIPSEIGSAVRLASKDPSSRLGEIVDWEGKQGNQDLGERRMRASISARCEEDRCYGF